MLTPFHSLRGRQPRLMELLCVLFLFGAGLAATPARAQEVLPGPLTADPGRAQYAPSSATLKAQYRTTVPISLPFFDDFTTPLEGPPSSLRWLPTGG